MQNRKTGAGRCSLTIGLTGGIGSGKSTVASYFSELGVPTINTDAIARKLSEPGQAGFRQIIDHFGKQLLKADGTLNRAELRTKIFNNPAERYKLEQILHPLIRTEMQQQLQQQKKPYCLIEIPLLLEAGWHNEVNRILVVDAPHTLQIERTIQRNGISKEEAKQIIATQIERNKRLAAADDIVYNKGSLTELEQQVGHLHQFYQKLVQNPADIE